MTKKRKRKKRSQKAWTKVVLKQSLRSVRSTRRGFHGRAHPDLPPKKRLGTITAPLRARRLPLSRMMISYGLNFRVLPSPQQMVEKEGCQRKLTRLQNGLFFFVEGEEGKGQSGGKSVLSKSRASEILGFTARKDTGRLT